MAEVVEERTGLCPRYRALLTRELGPVLLEEARRAERAQMGLVGSLHRLVSLPGYLEIGPHSVFRNLLEEVNWERDLRDNPVARVRRLPRPRGVERLVLGSPAAVALRCSDVPILVAPRPDTT